MRALSPLAVHLLLSCSSPSHLQVLGTTDSWPPQTPGLEPGPLGQLPSEKKAIPASSQLSAGTQSSLISKADLFPKHQKQQSSPRPVIFQTPC